MVQGGTVYQDQEHQRLLAAVGAESKAAWDKLKARHASEMQEPLDSWLDAYAREQRHTLELREWHATVWPAEKALIRYLHRKAVLSAKERRKEWLKRTRVR